MKHRVNSHATVWIQGVLWIVGCFLLGYAAFLFVNAQLAQSEANATLEEALETKSFTSLPTRHPDGSTNLPEGSLVAKLRIPRIHLSSIVFEGTSDSTLALGVGHMTGSGTPGELGNIVYAGHRDTFFRGLRKVRKGDDIVVTGSQGEFWYRVTSLSVVEPNQVEVLRAGTGESLTLITCYPFSYLGSAPQRYIVRAERIAQDPHTL